jgi:hypothetical protein
MCPLKLLLLDESLVLVDLLICILPGTTSFILNDWLLISHDRVVGASDGNCAD